MEKAAEEQAGGEFHLQGKSMETGGQAEPEAWRTESFSPKGIPHEQGEGMKEGKNSSNYTANIFLSYGNINNI